jgi:acetyltransferase-like isoleucine patch superfamily enzyme
MKKRLLFYFFIKLSFLARISRLRSFYMKFVVKAHTLQGVKFSGLPRYIDYNSKLDPIGSLTIGERAVISTGVLILTHDYSYTTGLIAISKMPKTDIGVFKPVVIGENCFIGARAIILPGSLIGDNVIIGAGAVVKGVIPNDSIVIGNPGKVVKNTKEWACSYVIEEKFLYHDKN